MADRPIDVNLTKGTEVTASDAKPTYAEIRARIARVLSRGMVVDRLHVDLPPDLHGEWVHNDPVDIARMEMLGYAIDTEHAVKRSLNDKADGSAVIGDVIFMTCPKEFKQAYDEHRRQQYAERHLNKRQREETEFLNNNEHIGMPAESTSTVTNVDGVRIKEALKGE